MTHTRSDARGAGERRYRRRIFSLLVILLGLRALVLLLGIDRLVTVTWTTPLVLGLATVAGICAFVLLFRELAVGMGLLRTIALSAMVSIAIWFLVGALLGVLAQHVPGKVVESVAIVEHEQRSHSARNVCRLSVRAESKADGSELKFCIRTARGSSVGPDDLKAGDVITVRLRQTVLGTTVESASRGA